MIPEIREARTAFGRRLAVLSRKIRIEDQGVIDLGEDAPRALGHLYVPGRRELRMGFWRGEKVWDIWAVHAFALWGCDHPDLWAGKFDGLRSQSTDVEEDLAHAATQTDLQEWRLLFNHSADLAINDRDLSLQLWWLIGCLKDTNRAEAELQKTESEPKSDTSEWLLYADIRSRLGYGVEAVSEALDKAESLIDYDSERQDVEDARLVYFGGGPRAPWSESGPCWELNLGGDVFHPNLAVILNDREGFMNALRCGNNDDFDSFSLVAAAIAAAFVDDDKQSAERYTHRLIETADDALTFYSAGRLTADMHCDFPRAHALLRRGHLRSMHWESLHYFAEQWLEQTGEREGTRIILEACKPRRKYCCPPDWFLTWAEAAHRLLGDHESVDDAVRSAEHIARQDDYYQDVGWDEIMKMWSDIGRPDEAERVRREAESRKKK